MVEVSERKFALNAKEYLLSEYIPELDGIGPGFKDVEYPALVIIFEDNRYIVYDYPKLDKLFAGITAALTAKKIKERTLAKKVK